MTKEVQRLLPTGECWCGCGAEVPIGSFFKPGHDKRAEAAVIKVKYGSIARFLDENGFGPDGRNAMQEWERLRKGTSTGEDQGA